MSLFPTVVALSDLIDGEEADFFALLTTKEQLTTRDGKPYLRVAFRDQQREVTFPVWADSVHFIDARDNWSAGSFYKLRARYQETSYGPQLEIEKIRAVLPEDAEAGFDPLTFQPRSRFDPEEMFAQLVELAESSIQEQALRDFVLATLEQHKAALLTLPAATRNHHAFVSGWLEHVLSVTRNCQFLADKYSESHADMQPPLNKDLVIAGGILHDIGKLHEIAPGPTGAEYTSAGRLIGHILQGRDIIREIAIQHPLPSDWLLRLEHIIVSHQRLPEWGSPKPPMTPEALLVHYADDVDAKFQIMAEVLREPTAEEMASSRNPLRQPIYRGGD
ncbi:MAG: HD domain-containing protein [Pirellulales bacterium]|nr:HD domain-containing protein [Pirellulales bacterium]